MANVIEYDASKHDIDAVTVFQTNQAEIKRRIEVDLKNGQNHLEIKHLPDCLDRDSIRVDGIGNAIVFDVIYHPPIPQPPPGSGPDEHSGPLGELNKQRAALISELAILSNQGELLKKYSGTLDNQHTTTEQLDTFLDAYASRERRIHQATENLNEQDRKLESDIKRLKIAANGDQEELKLRMAGVTIVVLGEGDGKAELSLTYTVSSAWWTPQYDLRASIAHDTKSNPTVNLHYRASITQRTGENWSNVVLTLSTASPLQGTDIPTLKPHWIHEKKEGPFRFKSGSSRATLSSFGHAPFPSGVPGFVPTGVILGAMPDVGGGLFGTSSATSVIPQIPPPTFIKARETVTIEGAVSATFAISGRSTIPSDSDDSSQTHKVSIAEIALSSVELEWITVPKETPDTFLQCKVNNTSQYVLLPGQTSVFMNTNFVAKSSIPHVSPQESFSCSLGMDPAIRVTYHPQSKKRLVATGSVIGTKTISTTFEQRITIKNTRLTPVRRLVLKDQVPVSSDARIKVNILEPKDLQSGKAAKQAAAKRGVRARWVPQNEDVVIAEEASKDMGYGLIEWICEIDPGASVDILLAWEVNAPVGVEWITQ